ncbi:hypothetical protein HFP15_31730 [Amycolatopsis sp. K13G38]|uniref:MmpS family membrane protein n=2 Tax=Amycolatopsis acididurans TaxID=2724524 RepID=A0ABX1JG99_9PSEU|nr:hypothetical protein [Amycolatopsis acididurans]
MPWVLGVAIVAAGTVTAVQLLTGTTPVAEQEGKRTSHQVVYEVTGTSASEIRYVIDGARGVETVTRTRLPWRVELPVEVGPGLGVVQVSASRPDPDAPLSCSVTVDGKVAQRSQAMRDWSSVSCSAVIRPGAE